MDHLLVLRDKVTHLRQEIADIQQANEQFRRNGLKLANAQIAHGKRNEGLQAIQQELARLADLGRKVVSTEQMKEKHRARLGKQKATS
jgi:multidrug resistance efflux pump